ncbi:DUF342 domain-containing protein [Neptuniibacter sp.]|uniref:DUF342 domain-containing protein n=1 Tax=Neptuniibacter sp. TaxID=1962643 RepID=UPI0026045ABA|nr:FapA family protein [Neptuniibacter sp.]MCP4597725.1 DUF342 domain-containing protein [Neptuniibacter sp.]
MACLSLREAEDHLSVEAVLEHPDEGETVDFETIQHLLEEADLTSLKWEDAAINQIISAAEEPDNEQTRFPISFIIAKRIDAQLSLQLSADKLTATATIRAAYGGKPIGPKQLKQALAAANIRKGLRNKELSALLKEAHQAKPGSTIEKEIACGRNAEHGKDGEWISDVKTLRQQLNQPKERGDGTVDLLDFGEIMTVKEGELLMHLEPPTPGKMGFTVTGEVIPPKPGKEVPFTPSEGVILSESKDQILAARQGLPVEQPRGMRVDQIYTAAKVDIGTGHISFDGSVIIQGDVEDGMKISATGDITIGGSVYYAHIEAGGDIIVRKGVIGRQQQDSSQHFNPEELNCHLQAEGHVQIGFAQYAKLDAEKGIIVDKQLLHCLSQTRGLLEIGRAPRDRNSKLIGGLTHACKGVSCANYGTEAFIPTEIRLCCHYEESKTHEQQLSEKLNSNQKLLNELRLLLPEFKTLPKTMDTLEKTKRLVSAIKHTAKLVSALKHQIRKLRAYRENQLHSAQMIARGYIYPNVKVYIADLPYKFTKECAGGGIAFRDGEAMYEPELRSF